MNILKSCRLIIQSFQRVTKRYLFQVILSHQCLPNQLRHKRKPLLFPAFLMGSQQTFIVNDTKDEQIYNLNAEVKALKSFIVEQLYVIKKSIEDIKCQGSIPNSSDLLQSLKEELSYLRSENLNKTSIIKSLTETIVFLLILIQLYFHQICITKKYNMKNINLQQISYMDCQKQMAKVLLIYMKPRAKEIKKSITI